MTDTREMLRAARDRFEPPHDVLEALHRRRERRDRVRRVSAIAVTRHPVPWARRWGGDLGPDRRASRGRARTHPRLLSGLRKGLDDLVIVADGSTVALTRGYFPTGSPDHTTIAFLRDPRDPHYDGHGDPFVLQVWLIHPDGSGLRKVGQQRECCVGASVDLSWSPDGSSIVLNAIHEQRIDVATGESLPMPPPTG